QPVLPIDRFTVGLCAGSPVNEAPSMTELVKTRYTGCVVIYVPRGTFELSLEASCPEKVRRHQTLVGNVHLAGVDQHLDVLVRWHPVLGGLALLECDGSAPLSQVSRREAKLDHVLVLYDVCQIMGGTAQLHKVAHVALDTDEVACLVSVLDLVDVESA